ncbi:hypothetical protein MNBD_ALPHA08-1093 [hydrothermal vent metagenome]|uniref:Murein endopeptidase K n=1 Tax=hydrothermal vent metagenome TaxID=652676 RepID=A0A3B0S4P7_9ZZZZ
MFVSVYRRSNLARISIMLLLAVGVTFSTTGQNVAQAARAETVTVKKAATNFNKQTKVKKVRVKRKFNKTRRALKRKKTNALPRLPSKRKLTGQRSRGYRGLNPRLVRLLIAVQRRYGRAVIVSSGCRSYSYNRRIGGARKSLHVGCRAADFKVAGVSKVRLRRFVSRLPGRGGVGTYCGRSIVHLDIGPVRSWYQGCRKRKRSRRS